MPNSISIKKIFQYVHKLDRPDGKYHTNFEQTTKNNNDKGLYVINIRYVREPINLDVWRSFQIANSKRLAHFHFTVFIQLAVTIIGLMEQYLRNKDTTNSALNVNDTSFKSLVWHEASHWMRLRIAHHRMYDNDKVDKRANIKHLSLLEQCLHKQTDVGQ